MRVFLASALAAVGWDVELALGEPLMPHYDPVDLAPSLYNSSALPVKLLSVDSVFTCLTAPAVGGVVAANCTGDQGEISWDFPLPPDSNEAYELRLPLSRSPLQCLGADESSGVGLRACGDEGAVWVFGGGGNLEDGAFLLRHNATGLCLKFFHDDESLLLQACPEAGELKGGHIPASAFRWLPTAFSQLVPLDELPLRVVGRDIVGSSGHPVKLRGSNWAGAYMSTTGHVANGLINFTLAEVARAFLNLGVNSVRLSFGTQMEMEDQVVGEAWVQANPELVGMNSMEVFDKCLETLTEHGLLVILNNHVTANGWCCDKDDGESLWFNEDWPEDLWLGVLRNMSARYRWNRRMIGIDLRNEPRPDIRGHRMWWTWWGNFMFLGNWMAVDVRSASAEGSKSVWHGNPEALVFIEGNWAVDLATILDYPLSFGQSCLHSRVVYSVHDYPWFMKWDQFFRAADGNVFSHPFLRLGQLHNFTLMMRNLLPWHTGEPTYADYAENRDALFGYLLRDDSAPVWLGEFGGSTRPWLDYVARYVEERDMDWSIWALFGGYGLLDQRDGPFKATPTVEAFRQIRRPQNMFFLLRGLAASGVQARQRETPGECAFDASSNPVRHGFSPIAGKVTVQVFFVMIIAVALLLLTCCCCCCCCCCRWTPRLKAFCCPCVTGKCARRFHSGRQRAPHQSTDGESTPDDGSFAIQLCNSIQLAPHQPTSSSLPLPDWVPQQ